MEQNGRLMKGMDFKNKPVNLAEIAGSQAVIEDCTFIDCEIYGPAVIVVGGRFQIYGNRIDGDPDEILWTLPEGREYVVGAIEVKNCRFIRCTFTNVGFAGHSAFLRDLKHSLVGDAEKAAM